MATKLLQDVLERASELPEGEQDRLAVWFLDAMREEAIWNELFARPESQIVMDRLAAEARRAWDAGLTEPGGFGGR
jgi:hypothetical protein